MRSPLRSPASPCVLVAFSCVVLRSIESSCVCVFRVSWSRRSSSVPPAPRTVSVVPRSTTPRSVIRPIVPFPQPFRPRAQFRGARLPFFQVHFPFPSPFSRASASPSSSLRRRRCCLPQYPQSFPEFSPFLRLEGTVCFSFPPPSSHKRSYRVSFSRRSRFCI